MPLHFSNVGSREMIDRTWWIFQLPATVWQWKSWLLSMSPTFTSQKVLLTFIHTFKWVACDLGVNMIKYAQKIILKFFNFKKFIEFIVSCTQSLNNFYVRKMDEKYVLNWLVIQNFQNTFTLQFWSIMIRIWKVETISIHTRPSSTWKYNNSSWWFTIMYI